MDYNKLAIIYTDLINVVRKANSETDCSSFLELEDDKKENTLNIIKKLYNKELQYCFFDNRTIKPEDVYNKWCEELIESGWKYGEIKSYEDKTHPCLSSYDKLNYYQKLKDSILISVIKTVILDIKTSFLAGDLGINEVAIKLDIDNKMARKLTGIWLR